MHVLSCVHKVTHSKKRSVRVRGGSDIDALTAHVVAASKTVTDAPSAAVIVDCTSSESVANRYGAWLAAGVSVVTPNKKANSGDLARYKAYRAAATASGAKWLYETTIGGERHHAVFRTCPHHRHPYFVRCNVNLVSVLILIVVYFSPRRCRCRTSGIAGGEHSSHVSSDGGFHFESARGAERHDELSLQQLDARCAV